jgi:alkanesulfonate monooxygenase SsuD/methylene tetrahydromethanopterin reductase-like flavin-dependent oxidoreductase (luciferase family)
VTELGVVFRPQLPPERLRAVVQSAEQAGLAQLWLWEDCFRQSGIASAAAALAWTERLTVGIGLLPVPLRNAAITAMEIANLERMFPGRSRIGLGHGVQGWMAQVGARASSPLGLLAEHLAAVRGLLRGAVLDTDGAHVRLDRVALDWPPATAPAVFAGATGDRTLRLSGELADGTILVAGTTPDGVARARGLIDSGRAAGDRTGPHPVVLYLHAATGPDATGRLAAECAAWGCPPDPDHVVAGDATAIAAGARRWAAAGADIVVLQPTPDEPDIEGFVRFAATEVAPLLR